MKDRKLRKTGIEVIGDVPWGTHFCLFYQTKQDLVDILPPYFKAGLENNEFCMWVTSEPLNVENAKRALERVVKNLDDYVEKGQIEILDYSQWYTKSGKFNADEVLQGWVEKEAQAVKRGFDGLRLTGNTFWLEKEHWREFTEYEAAIDRVIGQYRMLAVCTYSLDRCGAAEVIDVVSNHKFALIERDGKWEIIESVECKGAVEALRRSLAQLQTLQRTAQVALQLREPYQVMRTVAEEIVTNLGYDSALVVQYVEEENMFSGLVLYPLIDSLDQALALVGYKRPKDKLREHRVSYRPGTNPLVDRVIDGEAVLSDSLSDFLHPWIPRPVAVAIQKLFGMESYISLPMRVRGCTIGTILAGVRKSPITADQQKKLHSGPRSNWPSLPGSILTRCQPSPKMKRAGTSPWN